MAAEVFTTQKWSTEWLYFYNEIILCQNNYAEQFLNNFGLIEFIINNLLEIYKQYPLKECDSFCNPIDIEEGLELVDAFFGSLGNDFYQLFTKIMEEKRISYKNNLPEYGILPQLLISWSSLQPNVSS